MNLRTSLALLTVGFLLILAPLSLSAQSPVSLQIIGSRGYICGTSNEYCIEGVVKNTTNYNMTNIQVQGSIYYVQGGSVIEQRTSEAYIPILKPNEISPFWIGFYEDQVGPFVGYYSLSALGFQTSTEPYRPLQIINTHTFYQGDSWYLTGEYVNTSSSYLKGYQSVVHSILWNSGGALVATDPVWPSMGTSATYSSYLAPGASWPFMVSASSFDGVAGWELVHEAIALNAGQYPVPLQVSNIAYHEEPSSWGGNNDLVIDMDVLNYGDRVAENNKVLVTFYDAQGHVIDINVNSFITELYDLPAGQKQHLTLELYSSEWPAETGFTGLTVQAYSASLTNQTFPTPAPTFTPTSTPTRTLTPSITPSPTRTPTLFPTPEGGWPYNMSLPLILHR
jgi:hypothetical protein